MSILDAFVEKFLASANPPLTEREKEVAALAIGYALASQTPNRCHLCTNVAVHPDAALCLTCSAAAGWCQVLADPCADTEVVLPTDCDVDVSALREDFGRAL